MFFIARLSAFLSVSQKMRTGEKVLHERLYEEAEKKKKDLQLMVYTSLFCWFFILNTEYCYFVHSIRLYLAIIILAYLSICVYVCVNIYIYICIRVCVCVRS